ncbi:MAG: ParA family protein [Bacteroidota bacterium]
MKIIAVISSKGGTSKTSLGVNVAAALAERGHRALVVDLDHISSASNWLLRQPPTIGMGEVLTGAMPIVDIISASTAPGVDIAPSGIELLSALATLSAKAATGAVALTKALAPIKAAGVYDVVILDTPGTTSMLQTTALFAADEVVISAVPETMTLDSLAGDIETIAALRDDYGRALVVSGIAVSRYTEGYTDHRRVIAELNNYCDSPEYRAVSRGGVFPTYVRRSVKMAESPAANLPVTLYAPDSAVTADVRSLALEIFTSGDTDHA